MMENIKNFRRIKVNGYKNNDSNLNYYLLRGGPLDKIDKDDIDKLLNHYNLKTVVDFRSENEANGEANKIIDGVSYHNITALDPKKSVSKNPKEFLMAYKSCHDLGFMEHLYSEFVLNSFTRNSYRKFLEVVANSNGSVYFHCSAGKDRTGFAAMLLFEILKVDDTKMWQDYLKTNDISEDQYKVLLKELRNYYDELISDDILKAMIGVRESYLQTSINLINKNYGSIANYISKGLNVDEKTLNLIRKKYQL